LDRTRAAAEAARFAAGYQQPLLRPLRYFHVQLIFKLGEQQYRVSDDDGRWLIEQLRLAVGSAPAESAAEKLTHALDEGRPIETTLDEKRELVGVLERGAGKPRSTELRRFEVEVRTIVYAERYFGEEG
jgi:hypothetical protein